MANAFVNKIYSFFQWLWFEYTIFTALYMLGHREKIAFTSCLVVIIATASYSTYVFLPHYLSSLISYFAGSAENTPQQIARREDEINESFHRIETMERALRLKEMLPEERTKYEEEIDMLKSILKTNLDQLRSLRAQNHRTGVFVIALVFICFLCYGLYAMFKKGSPIS